MDDEALTTEIEGSIADLADLGLPRPRTFAYPYGEHDDRSRAAARAAGLEAAFIISPGVASPGQDPYRIPRVEIQRDDGGWRFLAKVVLAGRLPALERLLDRSARVRRRGLRRARP